MKKEESNDFEFLQELSPTLFENRITNKPNPPSGYFEGLADSVMDRIDADTNRKRSGKIIRLVNYKNIAIAAGIAVILALIPYLTSVVEDKSVAPEIAAVTIPADTKIEDLSVYLDENDLYSALENEGIEDLTLDEDISEDQIIEFLLSEGINEELLIEIR